MKRFTDTTAHRAIVVALAGGLMIAGSAFAQSTPSNTGGMSSGSGMSGSQTSPALSMSQEDIRSLQQALSQKGYNVGTVDGVWGPSTQNALRSFQSSEGITASGQLDSQTAQALGISMSADPNKGSSSDIGSGSGSNSTSSGTAGGAASGTTSGAAGVGGNGGVGSDGASSNGAGAAGASSSGSGSGASGASESSGSGGGGSGGGGSR